MRIDAASRPASVAAMPHYAHEIPDAGSGLREVLVHLNADELKQKVALIPSIRLKAPRKGELVDALVGCFLVG